MFPACVVCIMSSSNMQSEHSKAMWYVSVTTALVFFCQPYLCVRVRELFATYCLLYLLCSYYIMFPACVCMISSSNMQSEPIDPVTEVALFIEREKIQKRVKDRCRKVAASLFPVYQPVDSSTSTTPPTSAMDVIIDLAATEDADSQDSDDSAKTMTYPAPAPAIPAPAAAAAAAAPASVPTAVPVTQFPPLGFMAKFPTRESHYHHPVIPQFMAQVYLQVKERQTNNDQPRFVEPGMCSNPACVFSRGGLYRQYYACVERLVQLENTLRDTLYGEPRVQE